jgi:heme exporter protein D
VSALAHYFAMGGYAFYVWPAYALTAAVLGGLVFVSWRRYRQSARDLDRLQKEVRARR